MVSIVSHPVLIFDEDEDNNAFIMDPTLDAMNNWEDVLTDVFSFFDNECKTIEEETSITVFPQQSSTSTFRAIAPKYVPVTPCASTNELFQSQQTNIQPLAMTSGTASTLTNVPSQATFVSSTLTGASATLALLENNNKRTTTATTNNKKSNPKKRRRFLIEDDDEEDDSFYLLMDPTKDIEDQRRERNREHARKSRQRKKSLTADLELSLLELKQENLKLREKVYSMVGDKSKAQAMVEDRLAVDDRSDRFVAALKNPANRVVDKKTLKFLQGLRKNLHVTMNNSIHVVG